MAALPIFESRSASTISFEDPECDMPIATLCLSKCEAIIACIWLSVQLCTSSPEQAAEFVKQVDVTCLAVLVGNAHGHYKKPPKLDIERIAAIRKKTGGIPLVLHGGSGIPDDRLKLR